MTHDVPGYETGDDDVDHQLTRLLIGARARTLALIAQIDPHLEYGSYLVLLGVCERAGGIRSKELAEAMGLHKSTISRAVSSLEKLGLVERRTDPDDGRASLLSPTRKAREKVHAIADGRREVLATILLDWTKEDRVDFAKGLRRLNDASGYGVQ